MLFQLTLKYGHRTIYHCAMACVPWLGLQLIEIDPTDTGIVVSLAHQLLLELDAFCVIVVREVKQNPELFRAEKGPAERFDPRIVSVARIIDVPTIQLRLVLEQIKNQVLEARFACYTFPVEPLTGEHV